MSEPQASAARPGLSRVLGLWSLVIYGIVLVQPTAPMSPFGVVSVKAEGHVVTTLLIAMVAMLFTAISYGRMAAVYPSAGSAYVYVGRELHPALGYVTGWSMLFDYVMNTLICVILSEGQRHTTHTTAGSSGPPDHFGARFSQPSGVTATVSSCLIPNSPGT